MDTSAEARIDQAAADRAYLANRIATLKRELGFVPNWGFRRRVEGDSFPARQQEVDDGAEPLLAER